MAMKRKKKTVPNFAFRFSESQIDYWAGRYNYLEDDKIPNGVGDLARLNGCLDRDQLIKICKWKSRRPTKFVSKNYDLSVSEITRFAFSTPDEYSRIASLTTLHGVSWPTASVILHYCVDHSTQSWMFGLFGVWVLMNRRS